MPFGGLLSLAGPLVGIGGSLLGMSQGSPASNVQGYSYMGRPQADMAALGNTGALTALGNMGSGVAQSQANNPFIQSYLQNIQGVGQQGMQSGQALTQAGMSQIPNVEALMQMGFDPQQALYNQVQNTNQQQQLAMLNQSGVGGTPYGQGVAGQNNTNFNIDWQNNQLQRAATAAGAAGGLLNQIGNTTGTGLQQQQTGAGLPYSAMTGVNADALSALGGAGNIYNQSINDYLAYLSGGTNQQGANLNQANSAFNQSQVMGNNLGRSLSGLSTGWGNAFGSSPSYGGGNASSGDAWGGSSFSPASTPYSSLSASDYGAGF